MSSPCMIYMWMEQMKHSDALLSNSIHRVYVPFQAACPVSALAGLSLGLADSPQSPVTPATARPIHPSILALPRVPLYPLPPPPATPMCTFNHPFPSIRSKMFWHRRLPLLRQPMTHMRMYVCMYVCIYIYIYINICIYIS